MISELEVVGNSWGPTECREDYTVSDHYLFPSKGTSRDTVFFKFCSIWSMHCTDIILPNFVVLFSAYDWLLSFYSYPLSPSRIKSRHGFIQPVPTHSVRRKCMIVLLLLLSGNIELNPGPDINCLRTPCDFKSRSGLGVVHLHVRSLLPKLDLVKIWASSTDTDVLVLSETWLKKSITDKDIAIKGYNVFRCDRPRKGDGIAIYVRQKFYVTVQSSLSLSRQFEFLALKLELLNGLFITIVGCYRPPAASSETLLSLSNQLSTLDFNEILLTGDLNWDWLSSVSDSFKSMCDSFNLTQLVNGSTINVQRNPLFLTYF